MIEKLTLKNIKCFRQQEFRMAPLTVLCGENSAGKSTIIQALLLIRQSHNANLLQTNEINLAGEYFSVGHLSDLVSHDAEERELEIRIDSISFRVGLSNSDMDSYRMVFDKVDNINHDFFLNDFVYLCAERHGPRGSYDVRFDASKLDFGIFGQFAIAEFVKRASLPAKNQSLAQLYAYNDIQLEDKHTSEGDSNVTLEVAVKTVMRRICPGFDINYKSYDEVDKVSSGFMSASSKGYVRPINTGFGVSCVLPIVVAAFCLPSGSTFIVENPEIHLHPAAQSELADFLATVALTGIQVILETHSDHIINGVRLFCKAHATSEDEVIITSISRSNPSEPIKFISIDVDGNLSDTHTGFFDQAEKDLLKLF
jgi:predicted ATPase